MSKIHWCDFCQDAPATDNLILVWDDNNERLDDPILARFTTNSEVCKHCARMYHGVNIATVEDGRMIRTHWEEKTY